MSVLECVLSVCSAFVAGGGVFKLVSVRASRRKANAEAGGEEDKVLYERIRFLDERLSRLEGRVCFRDDCAERV